MPSAGTHKKPVPGHFMLMPETGFLTYNLQLTTYNLLPCPVKKSNCSRRRATLKN